MAEDKVERAKRITRQIDYLLLDLAGIIESAETREQADEIFRAINRTSDYLRPAQIQDVWNHLMRWERVSWGNEED